jgi:hypothetical protein
MGPNDRELRIMRILQDLDEVRRHIRKCTLFAVIVASVMLAEVIVFYIFSSKAHSCNSFVCICWLFRLHDR